MITEMTEHMGQRPYSKGEIISNTRKEDVIMYSAYLGHQQQTYGVESYRLSGGKGDGMRMLDVRNGKGLRCTLSPDRCLDISRMEFMGQNLGFFSPCGHVAPTYYDDQGAGFLKSFTAGFLTTCGLANVGVPHSHKGVDYPLHGTIGNLPVEHVNYYETADSIVVEATVNDCQIFGDKLKLHRQMIFSMVDNTMTIHDRVENCGANAVPVLLLYHLNMGYPLLSEAAEVYIGSSKVVARNDHAAKDIDRHTQPQKPQGDFEEQCYFHYFEEKGVAGIFNPDLDLGLAITFDLGTLNQMCQWNMFGVHDYVMGLEPGNCAPDGRKAQDEQGALQYVAPGEDMEFTVKISMAQGKSAWSELVK